MEKQLSIGDWRLMEFGYEEQEWYVYRVSGNKVLVGSKKWLVGSSMWMDKDEFLEKSTMICKGKFRWWWLLLPFVNNCICPFSKLKN